MTGTNADETMEAASTSPKPFVFVLMPFDPKFEDIYKFGIKGAAEDVGAYAERIDEQIFVEGILERIFNQINKADVIVADMTGRNPNVFYEVGYAHALNKIALLLTQSADDIPLDLKHRPHIVYRSIEDLRKDLARRLHWAISEAKRSRTAQDAEHLTVFVQGERVNEAAGSKQGILPVARTPARKRVAEVCLRNDGTSLTDRFTHIYLFIPKASMLAPMSLEETSYYLRPMSVDVEAGQGADIEQFQLDHNVDAIPPGAVERFYVTFSAVSKLPSNVVPLTMRLHQPDRFRDYRFQLQFEGV